MKLKLTTIYENIDKEWLDWWIKLAGPNYEFKGKFPHSFTSKDLTSDAIGTTTIELKK